MLLKSGDTEHTISKRDLKSLSYLTSLSYKDILDEAEHLKEANNDLDDGTVTFGQASGPGSKTNLHFQ